MAYYQALTHGDNSTRMGTKVYSYHGTKDQVISINDERNALNVLNRYGVSIKLEEFYGDHHGVTIYMKSSITHAIESELSSLN